MNSIPADGVFESNKEWIAYKNSLDEDVEDMICIEVKYDSIKHTFKRRRY